jgi:hypothetical protein
MSGKADLTRRSGWVARSCDHRSARTRTSPVVRSGALSTRWAARSTTHSFARAVEASTASSVSPKVIDVRVPSPPSMT